MVMTIPITSQEDLILKTLLNHRSPRVAPNIWIKVTFWQLFGPPIPLRHDNAISLEVMQTLPKITSTLISEWNSHSRPNMPACNLVGDASLYSIRFDFQYSRNWDNTDCIGADYGKCGSYFVAYHTPLVRPIVSELRKSLKETYTDAMQFCERNNLGEKFRKVIRNLLVCPVNLVRSVMLGSEYFSGTPVRPAGMTVNVDVILDSRGSILMPFDGFCDLIISKFRVLLRCVYNTAVVGNSDSSWDHDVRKVAARGGVIGLGQAMLPDGRDNSPDVADLVRHPEDAVALMSALNIGDDPTYEAIMAESRLGLFPINVPFGYADKAVVFNGLRTASPDIFEGSCRKYDEWMLPADICHLAFKLVKPHYRKILSCYPADFDKILASNSVELPRLDLGSTHAEIILNSSGGNIPADLDSSLRGKLRDEGLQARLQFILSGGGSDEVF